MELDAIRAPATARCRPQVEPGATTYAALGLLGVTVTAFELPTAVPYFGAIALLHLPACRQRHGCRCWCYIARFVLRPT